jgi:hypothetical protein
MLSLYEIETMRCRARWLPLPIDGQREHDACARACRPPDVVEDRAGGADRRHRVVGEPRR